MHLILISLSLLKSRHGEAGLLRCKLMLQTFCADSNKVNKKPRERMIWKAKKKEAMENECIQRRNGDG